MLISLLIELFICCACIDVVLLTEADGWTIWREVSDNVKKC